MGKVKTKIVVGLHIKKSYQENGVKNADDIIVSNSFISPPLEDEEKILARYPKVYNEFQQSHSPLITTSAYQIAFIDGIDLYGLDMCIDLMLNLKTDYPNAGLVLFLANDKMNAEYFKALKNKIKIYGLHDNILFITGQRELWPVYKNMDLMIRPTYSDGFGVSVAEAIYFGCPALASDVCERAVGTHLFRNRDQNDFYNQAKTILALRFGPTIDHNDE
ncbi:glycosyltransferase [Thermodesulfobacteriota bacterium]